MPPLEAGIVEWVNTFGLSSACANVSELSDGLALGEILLEIAPGLFDFGTMKQGVGDNWALKLNNLKKLVFNLQTYYREYLGKEADFSSLDLSAVAREASSEELRGLVQILVGAALSCPGKVEYIPAIMKMSVEGQATMQQMAQQAMAGMATMPSVSGAGSEGVSEETDQVGDNNGEVEDEDWGREGAALEASVAASGDRGVKGRGNSGIGHRGGHRSRGVTRDDLEVDEEGWGKRLANAEATAAAAMAGLKEEREARQSMERSNGELRETVAELEAQADARRARDSEESSLFFSLESLRSSLEEKEALLASTREEARIAETRREQEGRIRAEAEAELRQLADELDVAKSKAFQLAKAEATVEKYKRRIDEMAELKHHLKELDSQNAKYLDQMLELESTAKTIPTLKKKIEQYKDQAVELERQKFEATSAAAVKDAEVQRLREELETASQAKMFFEDELIALRDEHRAQTDARRSLGQDGEEMDFEGSGGIFEGAASRAELRERVARLERENALLVAKMEGGAGGQDDEDSQVALLESKLEDALRIKDERATDALEAKRNAADLEQQLHKLRQVVNDMEGTPRSAAQEDKSLAKVKALLEENARLRTSAEERESLGMTVQSLEDVLKEKETEVNNLQADKEKLESYTKKTLHKFNEKYMVALKECKAQLADKQDKIDHLEMKLSQDKATAKWEERLLMSSVYELGMDVIESRLKTSLSEQGQGTDADVSGGVGAGGGSWMQRQRAHVKQSNPVAL